MSLEFWYLEDAEIEMSVSVIRKTTEEGSLNRNDWYSKIFGMSSSEVHPVSLFACSAGHEGQDHSPKDAASCTNGAAGLSSAEKLHVQSRLPKIKGVKRMRFRCV